jgi:hypothetical protein
MRFTLFTIPVVLLVLTAFAVERFRAPEGFPRLRIKSVATPKEKSRPLELTVELTADGKTPVSVSREQFSVHISPYPSFIADAIFPTNAPQVFTVPSQKSVSFTLSVSTNRFDRGERWSELRPGKHTIQVYLNSGKSREFDYQFLGQTYSDSHEIEIK